MRRSRQITRPCTTRHKIDVHPGQSRLICSKPRGRVGAVSEGVFRHPEVVEDAPRVAVESAHGGCDAVVGVGTVAGADALAILVEGAVEDVVDGLDFPVAAVEFEEAPGVGAVRGVAGDAEGVFDGGLAGLLFGGGALDEEGLADAGEGQVAVEPVGGPDGAAFDATVLENGGSRKSGSARSAKNTRRSSRRVGWLSLAVNTKWAPRRRRKSASLRWVSRASAVEVRPAKSRRRPSCRGRTVPISIRPPAVGVRLVSSSAPTGRQPTFFGCG